MQDFGKEELGFQFWVFYVCYEALEKLIPLGRNCWILNGAVEWLHELFL